MNDVAIKTGFGGGGHGYILSYQFIKNHLHETFFNFICEFFRLYDK